GRHSETAAIAQPARVAAFIRNMASSGGDSPEMPRDLAAVVFDFDGVIVDSETAEYESHRLIFERCGARLTPEEWCRQGGGGDEGQEFVGCDRLRRQSATAPDRDAFKSEQSRLFRELVPQEPMRGITSLLDALADAGVPRAIASTSPSRWVVGALD